MPSIDVSSCDIVYGASVSTAPLGACSSFTLLPGE
jgi:hypothetical protein